MNAPLEWPLRRARAHRRRPPLAPPFRRKILFEALEPRLLFSADVASPAVDELLQAAAVPQDEQRAPALLQGEASGAPAAADAAVYDTDPASGASIIDEGVPSSADAGPAGQLIFLDLDGALGVDYEGPVSVDDIDVAAFSASGALAGHEDEIAASILALLDEAFSGSGVAFTLDQPLVGDFSTIYIGGDGDEFAQWGRYYGLSEKVDTGNLDASDIAFVFSDNISAAGLTAQQYGELLGHYIGHEAGHLLGLEHAHTVAATDDPLAEVAFKPYTHVEIAKDVLADLFGDPNTTLDDGKLTIAGNEYDVHPKIVAALKDYSEFYFAGAVGPDGFPDLAMGQGVIHPTDTGTWLTRILDMAWQAQSDDSFSEVEKSQILAWSYGFLTHAAGDQWSHTLVNEFSEGVFPAFADILTDQRDLANAVRHILVEAYVGNATHGFDGNRDDRTRLPDGDVSDDSTPAVPLDAPIRFIYETLIRPFPFDPSALLKTDLDARAFTINGTARTIASLSGSFIDDGFTIDQKITTSGFADPANNGVFHVTAVTATTLTVREALASEGASPASGDETIEVFVPYTEKTRIDVDAAADAFVRTSGSFIDDGFVEGQRFTVYGLNDYSGDYLVKTVDALTLTVWQDLGPADETGDGDEQLVVQGKRGKVLDTIFAMRDAVEMAAIKIGPRLDLGPLVSQTIEDVLQNLFNSDPESPGLKRLYGAYLYNWVDDINEGLRHWGEAGLAVSRALFDPQSRRDLQNEKGKFKDESGADRARIESDVNWHQVMRAELDDLNGDGRTNDSFINNHLLPMFGFPDQLGMVRKALQKVASTLDTVLAPLGIVLNPLKDIAAAFDEVVDNFIRDQIKERFGIDLEVYEFLEQLNSKMDLASITVGGTELSMFKPGDHERLDLLMGLPADHHAPLSAEVGESVTFLDITFTFYAGAEGRLADTAEFDKHGFAAYDNSVTLSRMLLLMEDPADGAGGGTAGANQLSKLYSDILTTLEGRPTRFEFSLLNLNGAHGGNVLTSTLPGIPGSELRPWLVSIDGDHGWRMDSQTTTTALFRISTQNDTASPAVWQTTVAPGTYKIYATWQTNVTQLLDNLTDSTWPDQAILPATNARYTIKDGTIALATQPDLVNQRRFASDPAFPGGVEDHGLAFRFLGTFTITGSILRVELSNIADGHVIAGPLLIQEAGGALRRVQNNRDPETLARVAPFEYSDDNDDWTDLVYKTGTGNDPLWESRTLRPVFRTLFDDWQNPGPKFPALGDPASSSKILFATGSALLTVEDKNILDAFAAFLKRNPNLGVTIAGHTDTVGDADDNQLLSERRALAVFNYLTDPAFGHAIDPARLTQIGFGETLPAVPTPDGTDNTENRRVELIVPLPSHATPFGPKVADQDLEIPIGESLKNLFLDSVNGLFDFTKSLE